MARRTTVITISSKDRDDGKRYLITELPAMQAEEWAVRAFTAMGRAGLDVDDDLISAGWAGIVAFGYRAIGALQFDDAKPLMDEMMTCVQALPSSNVPRALVDSDIEEVLTRLLLKKEVFELHAGFSIAALLSPSGRAAKKTAGDMPNTETSPGQSAP